MFMAADGPIAIPIRTIRRSSISMRSPQRRRRAPKQMLRERGENDRQAIAPTRAVRRPSDKCSDRKSVDEIGRPRYSTSVNGTNADFGAGALASDGQRLIHLGHSPLGPVPIY